MAGEIINQFKEKDGNDAFDRQIDSEGKPSEKTKKEGTRERPFNVGLFQEVTDINWGTGQFTYAGGTEPDDASANVCISGWSQDGQNWFGNAGFTINGSSNIFVSIRGNSNDSMIIFAGGYSFVQTGSRFDGLPLGYIQPMLCSSDDDGRSWHGVSIASEAHFLKDGSVHSVGYDPKTKLFYAGVGYRESLGSGVDIFTSIAFVGIPGEGFEEIFRTTQTTGERAFVFPPWPQKMKLCEAPFFITNTGPLFNTRKDIVYVSSNSAKQVLKVPDGKGEGGTIDVSLADVSGSDDLFPVSLCVGLGITVVVYNVASGGQLITADGAAVLGALSGNSVIAGTVSFS